MNSIFKFLIFAIVANTSLCAQNNFSVANIPDSLQVNANSVIRLHTQQITIKDEKNMLVNVTRIITVLNEDGNRDVDTYLKYDKDLKITKIAAVAYNENGFELKEFKKKDFTDQSAVNGFYSDDRVKFLNYMPRSYPYTIKFTYEYKTHSTGFIPQWYPFYNYNMSIQQSEYILTNLKNIPFRFKEYSFKDFNIENHNTSNILHYKIKNQKALKYEIKGPSSSTIFPHVKVCLENFTLKGYSAYGIKNWKDFGNWLRTNLYESQLELSDETKLKIKELVKNEDDPYKKAKLIYEYMQNKTRYVYVGIGIGGWQPNLATEVDRLSYGDCKGLSNYTKAMLDLVGIEANWVIVYAKNKRNLDKEFMGIQGNHMILNLPKLNNGKDVWLECTSKTMPFGFLGDFTDDRDVLVLEKEGGVIKHTPKYIDVQNKQVTQGHIKIDSLGNIEASFQISSSNLEYDGLYSIEKYNKTELNKYYKSSKWYYNNNLKLNKASFVNNKDSLLFKQELDVQLERFATVLGDEMLMRVNVFNMYRKSVKKQKNRKLPFYIKTGSVATDSFIISLPKNYKLDKFLHKKTINNKFGEYQIILTKVDDYTLKFSRRFYLKEGIYAKEEYNLYSAFLTSVRKFDNLKIALKRI